MASVPRGANVLRFPPFALDAPNARLYRGDEVVPLRGKTLAVLEYLAARPGRLVTKDELLREVWPEVHVSEDVLVGCVHELRQVFGDTRSTARFVETVYRRGYRWIAGSLERWTRGAETGGGARRHGPPGSRCPSSSAATPTSRSSGRGSRTPRAACARWC